MLGPLTATGTFTTEMLVCPFLLVVNVEVALTTAVALAVTEGAVYVTGLDEVEFNVPPPDTMDHVTPLPNAPVPWTVAVNAMLVPSLIVGDTGDTVTEVTAAVTGLTTTVA